MMRFSLPASWRLQETPPFGSAFIKSVESVKSVAAFCFLNPSDRPDLRKIENSDGRFQMTDVQTGTYLIYSQTIWTPGGVTKPQEVTLKKGSFYGEVKLQLIGPRAVKK